MEYYEQLSHKSECVCRPLLFADQADARLEKLEAVLIAAQSFMLNIEELIPGGCLEMCPELVAAVQEASHETII